MAMRCPWKHCFFNDVRIYVCYSDYSFLEDVGRTSDIASRDSLQKHKFKPKYVCTMLALGIKEKITM
jgi:hypothetical protein